VNAFAVRIVHAITLLTTAKLGPATNGFLNGFHMVTKLVVITPIFRAKSLALHEADIDALDNAFDHGVLQQLFIVDVVPNGCLTTVATVAPKWIERLTSGARNSFASCISFVVVVVPPVIWGRVLFMHGPIDFLLFKVDLNYFWRRPGCPRALC
jgi:hypothetical protein